MKEEDKEMHKNEGKGSSQNGNWGCGNCDPWHAPLRSGNIEILSTNTPNSPLHDSIATKPKILYFLSLKGSNRGAYSWQYTVCRFIFMIRNSSASER
jgi:hypothetical protein